LNFLGFFERTALAVKALILSKQVMKKVRRSEIRVGCLFAAIGGFCRAFEQGGATVAWANEKDKFATQTFRLNFPNVRCVEKDVISLSVHADQLVPVDVLTAGFPCQPFSVAGEKLGFQDERGLLFLHIIRIIREFGKNKPKILLLENVKNLKAHDKGRTFKRIQTEVQRAGYWFTEKDSRIMNTAFHTEIPQNRERIFMVAMSCDHFPSNMFEFPEPFPEPRMRTVFDFLDLDHKAPEWYYFKPDNRYYPLFKKAIEAEGKEAIYQLRRNYVRRNMSGMCFTLMANMGEGGHNQPVIKDRWGIRKLTERECARLQGYKDSWLKFPKAMSHQQLYKQIGNSITLPLVTKIADRVLATLEQSKQAIAAGAA
jgi:DNA (cytosine-5)-methyltransferase 1